MHGTKLGPSQQNFIAIHEAAENYSKVVTQGSRYHKLILALRVTMLGWNIAQRLVRSHMTSLSQLWQFISEGHSYALQKFVNDIGSWFEVLNEFSTANLLHSVKFRSAQMLQLGQVMLNVKPFEVPQAQSTSKSCGHYY